MPCCTCGLDNKIRVTPIEGVLCCILEFIGKKDFLLLRDVIDYVGKHEGKDLKAWINEHKKVDNHNNKEHITYTDGCAAHESKEVSNESAYIPDILK